MDPDERESQAGQLSTLLRSLAESTESAEREARARARMVAALRRVLTMDPRRPSPLLEAVTAELPALDSAVLLVARAGEWVVEVGPGDTPARPPAGLLEEGAILQEALRRREPVELPGQALQGLLPAGTRTALVLPFADATGSPLCAVVFGSRSEVSLDDGDQLVARIAAERLARAAEGDRLAARIAHGEDAAVRSGGFRDQVFAIVGHDLRNPLGAIVMSAALLQKKGALGGWQAKTVERVRASAARMGRIIDDLLSYTRTRLGNGIPVERRPTDLADVVRKMVDELRVLHPAAEIDLAVAGDVTGAWDCARMEQVISNLVSNAIDHGEEAHSVRIGLCGGGDQVELMVENRGEMPSAMIEHAFEAFHRGPEQTGRKASGLGLGLFIAREIVRRHGGEIRVRSGEGFTRVLMTLPRDRPDATDGLRA